MKKETSKKYWDKEVLLGIILLIWGGIYLFASSGKAELPVSFVEVFLAIGAGILVAWIAVARSLRKKKIRPLNEEMILSLAVTVISFVINPRFLQENILLASISLAGTVAISCSLLAISFLDLNERFRSKD